jgi:uncharacterized protein with HEPN domain
MKDDQLYLGHIKQAIEKIEVYSKTGRDEFFKNPMVQDAVIRNFEIIGEASKHLSDEVRAKCQDTPWRQIGAFRNFLIHNYMGVDAAEVWNVIVNHLPQLRQTIESLLAD